MEMNEKQESLPEVRLIGGPFDGGLTNVRSDENQFKQIADVRRIFTSRMVRYVRMDQSSFVFDGYSRERE